MSDDFDYSENIWEQRTLEELSRLEWRIATGTDIAPGQDFGRENWGDLILPERSLAALRRLNPDIPPEYLVQAFNEVNTPKSQDALAENFRLHDILVSGYRGISFVDNTGLEQNPTIHFISHLPELNDYLAVNQVTIRSREQERRFDVVLYVNGLPLSIIELKKAGDEHATIAKAHAQLVTYLKEFPMAFRYAVLTVIADGITARYGTPFTPLNHYSPWNVDEYGNPTRIELGDGLTQVPLELDDLINGILDKQRFGELQRGFVDYDNDGTSKRIAKPHQYFAVKKAVASTVAAAASNGKAGVVWHTQGSGKSMEMELYAKAVSQQPELMNPTLVVVTDRTDLDDQLFGGFDRSAMLTEKPKQIASRVELRAELSNRQTGGILFTTLQKFGISPEERRLGLDHPLLSNRRNVIVVVDEAHRSHYDQLDGYARHIRDALPHAAFIAFTGTPIANGDRNTREVFGDIIDTYDLTRAVNEGSTVPVYFEPRLITLSRAKEVTEADLDAAADEAATGLPQGEREKIEQAVAKLNAVYGTPQRIAALADDILQHWAIRSAAIYPFIESPDYEPGLPPATGKALVVGATRQICADLYDQIVSIHPDWHSGAVDGGVIKVVYSGSASDQGNVAKHVRTKSEQATIQKRLKDAEDPLQIVIVQNMLLAGFDAPPLHTMYLDRPLKGATLMQALARVNRTFRGKPDGLLVSYAPIADYLTAALAEYTETDQAEQPIGRYTKEAASLVHELLRQIDQLCVGYDWRSQLGKTSHGWIDAAYGLTNYLRSPLTPGNKPEGDAKSLSDRYWELSGQLSRFWTLAASDTSISDLSRDAKFYAEVRGWMAKFAAREREAKGLPVPEDIIHALAGLVASTTEVGSTIDIYAAAGMPKPALSDITPEFAAKTKNAKNPQLAIEALRDLLVEESSKKTRHNKTRNRLFSEKLQDLMNRYANAQLTSAQVIAALIELAKDVAAEDNRAKAFHPTLTADELAFYDAISTNDSAVDFQGPEVLAQIARELVEVMKRDVKTDWTIRDDVRAKLRSSVKRLLVRYRYPPDKQPEAIKLVIEQMEYLAAHQRDFGG